MRELDKIAFSAMPAPHLGRTLLLMAFYGLLKQPGVISFDDIEDPAGCLKMRNTVSASQSIREAT
jgi:hypothetical protein